MKKSSILFGIALATGLTSVSHAATAITKITATSTNTAVSGTARLEDTAHGLKVQVSITNAIPGNHGFHIHEFGLCDDMGKAAGGHFNPMGHPHGNAVKDTKHVHPGDMGNILIKSDGTGTLEAILPNVSLSDGKHSVGGRALIFHEKSDDFSQPTGNAGGRLGCGVITLTGN
jgi:superoxide dismutase, Cu-Zn family